MSTKTLNTRIQTKIDTLENWNESTLPLLAGEIAIATGAVEIANGLTEPVCIIRIGEDGKKTFSQLPDALHAKAIDVLPVCKDSDKLKEFIQNSIDLSDYLAEMEGYITNLTVQDEEQEGYYVSSVSQENGLINVTKKHLPNFLENINIDIGTYNEKENCILLKDENSNIISAVDASIFIKDGMLESAVYDKDTHKLTLTWNNDADDKDITVIDLNDLIDAYQSGEGILISSDGVISLSEASLNAISQGLAAIQTITANDIQNSENKTVPSGLIATKGENNDYNIAIDDSITFIFNCGDAGVTA